MHAAAGPHDRESDEQACLQACLQAARQRAKRAAELLRSSLAAGDGDLHIPGTSGRGLTRRQLKMLPWVRQMCSGGRVYRRRLQPVLIVQPPMLSRGFAGRVAPGASRQRRRPADAVAGKRQRAARPSGAPLPSDAVQLSAHQIAQHAEQTLSRIGLGIKAMEDSNPGLLVTVDEDGGTTVVLPLTQKDADGSLMGPDAGGGSYLLTFNGSRSQLQLSTPDLKQHSYELNPNYDAWMVRAWSDLAAGIVCATLRAAVI